MPIPGYDFKVTEVKLTCPFNPAHQVTDMQKHLTRCSMYNKDIAIKKCPFNATHWVQQPEFKYHLDHCPDKAPLERHLLSHLAGNKESGDLSMPLTYAARNDAVENVVEGWNDDGADGEWDIEVGNLPKHMRKKYDPAVATHSRDMFRLPTEHRGKSDRRKFRQENVEHTHAIQSGSVVDESEASSAAAPSVSTTGQQRRPLSNPVCCKGMPINPNLGMGRARSTPVPPAPVGAVAPEQPPPPAVGRGRGAVIPHTAGVQMSQKTKYRDLPSPGMVDECEASSAAAAPSVSTKGQLRRPLTNPICCKDMPINPNLGFGRARSAPVPPAPVGAVAAEPEQPRPPAVGRGRGTVALRTPGVRIGGGGDGDGAGTAGTADRS